MSKYKEYKNFIDLKDLPREDIMKIVDIGLTLKEAAQKGVRLPLLEGMTLGMLFDQESTRTRVSFECAMHELGGHALFLSTKTMHVGSGQETIRETAQILSSMCSALLFRSGSHETIKEFTKWSSCPVISGLGGGLFDGTEVHHPSQAIADLITIIEHKPKNKDLKDVVFMFTGDAYDTWEPSLISGIHLYAKLGMTIILATPKEYFPSQEWQDWIRKTQAENLGGKLIITEDPYEYIDQCDFVYTGVLTYHGHGFSEEECWKTFYPKYQVNKELMDKAPEHCGIMHCLPGNHNMEITDDVWYGPHARMLCEGENRLTAQRAILVWLLYPLKRHASEQLTDYYMGKVEDMVTERYINYETGC